MSVEGGTPDLGRVGWKTKTLEEEDWGGDPETKVRREESLLR